MDHIYNNLTSIFLLTNYNTLDDGKEHNNNAVFRNDTFSEHIIHVHNVDGYVI